MKRGSIPGANERTNVKIFPTAFATDLVFYMMADSTLPKNKQPVYGTPYRECFPHATEDFPHHILTYITADDGIGGQKWYFAAERENQDLYNFNFTKADIGGTKFDAVARTYVTLRDEFTPYDPEMGDPMPNVPEDLFTDDYVLAYREQKRSGDEVIASLFVAEELVYVKRCNIRFMNVDNLNGETLNAIETLYYATEIVNVDSSDSTEPTIADLFGDPTDAFWGVRANGYQRTGVQLSCEWYLVEDRQIISGEETEDGIVIGTWTTNDNYAWPPVLETFELMDWTKLDGGNEIYPAIRFHPEGYNGPCLHTITRTWSLTAFEIPAITIMLPTRMYYACPFYTLNISECLHPAMYAQCDIGNTDPVFDQNALSRRYFAATNYITWPTSVTAGDTQEPFRGGYLRTRSVASRPTIPPNVDWVTGVAIP